MEQNINCSDWIHTGSNWQVSLFQFVEPLTRDGKVIPKRR